MLSKENFQQKIIEVIRTNMPALFTDFEDAFGPEMYGDRDLIIPGRENSILWDHVSQEFANAIFELLQTKQIQAALVSALEYWHDGCAMTLPPATSLRKTDYKEPTWVPLGFSIRTKFQSQGDSRVN